jgi:hypothetical protein
MVGFRRPVLFVGIGWTPQSNALQSFGQLLVGRVTH